MTDPKRFSGLQARAALSGVELRACRNDAEEWAYYVTYSALTREFLTLDEVERWFDLRVLEGISG